MSTGGAEQLAVEIERLFSLLVRRKGQIGADEHASLTAQQRLSLAVLVDSGPLRLGSLAERTGATDPTATRTVDALARLGLAERSADADDRRAVQVAATDRGRRHVRTQRRRLVALLEQPALQLDEHERERFVELLGELNDLLERDGVRAAPRATAR